ncbi:aminotransferase class IV [Actinospica sp.]|uniref:aminotransferase class IV n=1 Tax=Actinospica sp. TaxID=1872142 RepID=UPI002CC5E34D|nr:aminotransferase class IV [Actinospica sp.]HWG24251.1 aminotransferase class IV [Actinospica sp.]
MIEVDGHEPTRGELQDAALNPYGHFTAMQVRDGRTRGLDLHLARLDEANRAVFGEALDGDRVRGMIRHALAGAGSADASVRVIVRGAGEVGISSGPDDGPGVRVFVTVRAPFTMPADATQRLKSAAYQRAVAHIKRPGDFGQGYVIDRAIDAGYDDALLVAPDGTIAESGIANIAFFDAATSPDDSNPDVANPGAANPAAVNPSVVWPDAPVLPGITMQLVAPRLAEYGMPSRTARVTLDELGRFAGACVTNSRGIAAVSRIDDVELPIATEFVKALHAAYDSVPWDVI